VNLTNYYHHQNVSFFLISKCCLNIIHKTPADYDEPNQDQKEILEKSQENGPGDRNRRERQRNRAFRKVEPHEKLLWFPIQEGQLISQSAVPHCGLKWYKTDY